MIFCLLLSSCIDNPEKISTQKKYFDLEGFFDQQVAQLYEDSLIVIKTSAINGKTDQHEMAWTDWKKELALFYGSDINKASYIGKYTEDTTFTNDKIIISYKATDRALRTRSIEIALDSNASDVQLIHIVNESSNFLSSTHEELYYEPFKSYIIRSTQKLLLFGGNTFGVKGDIVRKEKKYF